MRTTVLVLFLCVSSTAFAGTSEWIPVDVDNGHVIIPITIDGEPARALLDTGATGNAISEVFLASREVGHTRGKQVTVRGVNDDRAANMINGVNLGIFGIEFTIDQLLPVRTHQVDFIVGLPFFELFIVQIDYPKKRMRIIDRESLDLKKFSNVKMKRSAGVGHPQVRVELNSDHVVWLMLDTGNSGSILLRRSIAERRGWLDEYQTIETSVVGANAVVARTETFRLPSMVIGPAELENVLISVPAEGEESNFGRFDPVEWSTGTRIKSSKKTDGILGFDVLQHFVVTIDFKRGLLNLDLPR